MSSMRYVSSMNNPAPETDVVNVFWDTSGVKVYDGRCLERLTRAALAHPWHRARACMHRSVESPLQEMIIALTRDCVFSPHRHPQKEESIHMIDGELTVVVYSDDGRETRRISLTPVSIFAYRLCEHSYHTVIPRSDVVIYHETTSGPWSPQDTEVASWAPTDPVDLRKFLK